MQIIAEVACSHDGSLGQAHAYIDAVADAGADVVKFQCRIAAAESTPDEQFRPGTYFPQDASRYDYWKRMEFSQAQWEGLAKHAKDRGLLFCASAFSKWAVDMLDPFVDWWKVGSGETDNLELIDRMALGRKPVLVSSGMSSWSEFGRAIEAVEYRWAEAVSMQCTSEYPCPPDHVGINVLDEMRKRFGTSVGLSDHSGTIWPGIAAAVHGADVLEVHVCFSRRQFGPDTPASLTIEQLAQLVNGVRFVERMKPVDKDKQARLLAGVRAIFRTGRKRSR